MLKSGRWDKLGRTRKIISVFAKYGIDYLLDRRKTGLIVRLTGRKRGKNGLSQAQKFCRALEELGPTFIKFGQILSTRPDFLPPDFITELEKLQDQSPPFESTIAAEILKRELGKPVEDLFESFEMKPVAAASLSQVHKATLKNGKVVAVKIQRPDIRQTIEIDLSILDDLAGFVENRLHNGWNYRPGLMVGEFRKAIRKELDFLREARNLDRFRISFSEIEYIGVPQVYWDLTTSRVLTMEYIEGVKINEITRDKFAGQYDPKKVAIRGAEAILKQIFEDGFFHADPHPANLFVQPPDRIVMLDVGMTGYLDRRTRLESAKLLQAVVRTDTESVLDCFENLRILIREVDRERLREDLAELFDSYLGTPLKDLDIAKVSLSILGIMISHDLSFPPNLVLMIKAISMIESTGRSLYPEIDLMSIAKPFVTKLSLKRLDPGSLATRTRSVLLDAVDMAEQLPRDANVIMGKLRSGKLKFVIEHQDPEKLTNSISRSANRISLSLVIAALIIGSSLIINTEIPSGRVFGLPLPALAGYGAAILMSMILIRSVLNSKK